MSTNAPIELWRPTSDQLGSKATAESPVHVNGRKIDYLHIDSESNYFDTREQVKLRNVQWFVETTVASKLSGSNTVTGLFSRRRIIKDDAVYNSSSWVTSSTTTDPSGAPRPILSLDNDYFASGSLDAYRNGIEITQDKHWTAGLGKITAGTPGHLYASTLYGVTEVSLVDPDVYHEIDVFDPVRFISSGGDPAILAYPIVTSDANEAENSVLNGVIEPFPIRPVISNFSVNHPFEPHSTWGEYGNGNSTRMFGSDEVLTVDYYEPGRVDVAPFLDAVDLIALEDTSKSLVIGPAIGYLSMERKTMAPFEDGVFPRGMKPSVTYTDDLVTALEAFKPGGTGYVSDKQRAATSGFVYDNTPMGTDSIAFGGLLY